MKTNVLFASDLDNTLLFSHKHRKPSDICVEYLDGKEQGFFTKTVVERLGSIHNSLLFIPVTSRSIDQYKRIQFPKEGIPQYAVTTNGAILLVNGEVDARWHDISRAAVEPWQQQLQETHGLLAHIPQAKRFRIVDEMYLFTACDTPAEAEAVARATRGKTLLDVAVSGRKVYFFPPPINKGQALTRLKERFAPECTISAGDTPIDLPMLEGADWAIVPDAALGDQLSPGHQKKVWDGVGSFSDYVVHWAEQLAQHHG